MIKIVTVYKQQLENDNHGNKGRGKHCTTHDVHKMAPKHLTLTTIQHIK